MPPDARTHLAQLSEHTQKLIGGYEKMREAALQGSDPLALDRFAIHCRALCEALSATADRATELAGALLEQVPPVTGRSH